TTVAPARPPSDSRRRMPAPPIVATLCLVRTNGKLLLQRRAAGRVWAGRLNGPGGKLLPGEPPECGVASEVAEETGIRIGAPVVLDGRQVGGACTFDAEGETLLSCDLRLNWAR